MHDFDLSQWVFLPTVEVAFPHWLWVLLLGSCNFGFALSGLLSFDETQIWLGDLRVVCGCVGFCLCLFDVVLLPCA